MQIVFLDAYTMNHGDLDLSNLKSLGSVSLYERTPRDQILERCLSAQIVISNKVVFDRVVLSKLPALKYICVAATGYNNIDLAAAREQGVLVSNVVGYSTYSVSQQVFALLFALINQSQKYGEEVRAGKWSRCKDFSYYNEPIREIYGLTFGVYGFGKIGKAVAQAAKGFGMDVIAHHKYPERDKVDGVKFVDFDTLVEESDILSLHAPLTVHNKGLFDGSVFKRMKRHSLLINTSRGPVLNETDLAMALNAGDIAGAGLDVMVNEPPRIGNPLLAARNCVITPHHAWASYEARQRLLDGLVSNIRAFQQGQPINLVS
jgi:glycerate dehydrogenase